jgi:hypothetical protein
MVDTGKAIAELSEANNARAGNYTVDAPDLVISRLDIAPNPATLGQDLIATVQAKNVGTLGAGPFAVALWRNPSAAPTDGTGADASWAVSGLSAGAETAAYTWTFRPSAVGAYTAWAFADSAHAVTEGLETNNTSSTAYPVQLRAVRGRVTLDGVGLAGVTIAAGGKTATTDTDGHYAIAGLAAGAITVVPSLPGIGFSPRTLSLDVGAVDIGGADFTAYHCISHVFSTPGLVLFACPGDPVGRSAADVFGLPGLAGYSWGPDTSSYTQVTGALLEAVGYWTRIPAGGATATTAGPSATGGEYRVDVVPGWNLLGNPFAGKIDWTATEVELAGTRMTLSGAVAQGWLASYAWVYGPATGYVLIHATIPTARKQIATWEGFFLQATRPLTLVLHQAASAAGAMDAPPETVPSPSGSGFAISLGARSDSGNDAWNVVGVVPSDASGTAPMTVAEPPSLGRGVTLSLLPPGGGAPSAVDLRAASGTSWRWEAVVRGGTSGERVTVGCDDLRALPRAYDAVLTDLQTGKSVSLRTATGLSFVVGAPDEERRFALVVSARAAGLRVTGLAADSLARGGASIAYALSAPARVTIRVLNAAGRVVGEIASDDDEAAGARTHYWTGRSLMGSMLPAGRYSVRVIAESATGERTTAVTHVTLGGGM